MMKRLIKTKLALGMVASLAISTPALADQYCSKGHATFVCHAKNGKQIKVCNNNLKGVYTYTYGKSGKAGMVLKRTQSKALSNLGYALNFVNGAYRYEVFASGYDDSGKIYDAGGVNVYKAKKKISTVHCHKKPLVDNISDAYAGGH